MANYYYLTSSLPALEVGVSPEISLRDFDVLLRENLTDADFARISILRRYYDIQNMRALWREVELDSLGNLDEQELEEALLTRAGLPDYVCSYLDKYDDVEARLRYFPTLVQAFFREEQEAATGFLHDYLGFERDWRLVFVGFRAKQLGRDVTAELQFEDPSDDLVAQILAQRDVAHYEPPYRYEDLKPVFERHAADPLGLHQALCQWRFDKIQEMYLGDLFSLDRVLGYYAQLIIVERWQELDRQRGASLLEDMVKAGSE